MDKKDQIKLSNAAIHYLEHLKGTSSPETVESYASTIKKFVLHMHGGNPLIDDPVVREFIEESYDNPATRNKVLGQIKGFVKYMMSRMKSLGLDKSFTIDEITIRKYRRPRTIPTTVEDQDIKKFLETIARVDKQAWAVAILMITTGMRIGEVMKKMDGGVKEERADGSVFIRFKGKGEKERLVPLVGDGIKAFDLLAGKWKWSTRTIRRRFEVAEVAAGIDHLKPHWFRHTAATKLVEAGYNFTHISYLLGNTEQVCQNVYGRADTNRLNQMVDDIIGSLA